MDIHVKYKQLYVLRLLSSIASEVERIHCVLTSKEVSANKLVVGMKQVSKSNKTAYFEKNLEKDYLNIGTA